MTPFDPDALRAGCRDLVDRTALLRIDDESVEAVHVPADLRVLPPWDDSGFSHVPRTRAAAWLLAYNAINYSYWADGGPRWWTVVEGREEGRADGALGVMSALADAPVDDPEWLEAMSAERLGEVLAPGPGAGVLPLLETRAAALRELGGALRGFDGAPGLLDASNGSAIAFVDALVEVCPSWEDTREWGRTTLCFRKRAQLCASMIHGRLGGGVFADVDQLTAFADYRLPQVLRALGVLHVDPALAGAIERAELLPRGSDAEIALRAAAVDGADRLCLATGLPVGVIDHFLWRTAVDLEARGMAPRFHRTRCTDY